jgi:hypothetical protein
MKRDILLFALLSFLALSCSPRKYSEPPFGGMKGRVEMVKTWHLMPDVWRAGTDKSEIMYITVAAYDPAGNEICSALLDSLENIQSEAENIFDNGLGAFAGLMAGTGIKLLTSGVMLFYIIF